MKLPMIPIKVMTDVMRPSICRNGKLNAVRIIRLVWADCPDDADGAHDAAPTYVTIEAHGDGIEVVISADARRLVSAANWVRPHSVIGISSD